MHKTASVFSFYSLLFFSSFYFISGFNANSNLCQECNLDYYMSNPLSTNDTFIEASVCILKEASDVQYNMSYFISNITCSDPTTCLGTKNAPFDSLIQALIQIHSTDLAGKFMSQNIELYLLGTPHYILNNEIPNEQSIRFFRRMNATILVSPWYCDIENLNGCFDRSQSEMADIILKTDLIYFEIYKNFTLTNINLIGNDIVLSSSTELPCYGTQSICCDSSEFDQSINNNECGLSDRTIDLAPKNSLSKIYGLFNLRLLYDEDFVSQADILKIPTPILNLLNVSFNFFYSMISNNDGWLSLINFGTLGFIINLENVEFQACFFSYGFLYFSRLEEDPYFSYLTSSQMSQLYFKYPLSNLYNSSIIINGLAISDYNKYAFNVSTGFGGTFAQGMLNFFSGQINNTYYYFNNLMMNQIFLNKPLYLLTFQANSSNNIPNFILENLQIANNYLLLFAKINYCGLIARNLIHNNSSNSYSNNVFDFSESSSFSCSDCYFSNSIFSEYFLISNGSSIFFLRCFFEQIFNISIYLENGTISFNDSLTVDGSFLTNFLQGTNAVISLTNFSHIRDIDISFFLITSSLSILNSQFIQIVLVDLAFIQGYLDNEIVTFSNVSFIQSQDFTTLIRSGNLILIDTFVNNSSFMSSFIDHQGTNFSLINFCIYNSTFSYYNQIISNSINIILQNFTLNYVIFPTVITFIQLQNFASLKMNSIYLYNINVYYTYVDSWTSRGIFSFETNIPSFSELNDIYLMNITYYYFLFINLQCVLLNFHIKIINLVIDNQDFIMPVIPFFIGFSMTNFYEFEILNSTVNFVHNLALLVFYDNYQTVILDNVTIKNCPGVNYRIFDFTNSDDFVPNSVATFKNVIMENIGLLYGIGYFSVLINIQSVIMFNCSFTNIHYTDINCSDASFPCNYGFVFLNADNIFNYSINFCTFDLREDFRYVLVLDSDWNQTQATLSNNFFIQSNVVPYSTSGCIQTSNQMFVAFINNTIKGFYGGYPVFQSERQFTNVLSTFQAKNITFLNNYYGGLNLLNVIYYFNVTISNLSFVNNSANYGFWIDSCGSVQLENLKYERTTSYVEGGLIFLLNNGAVSITNVISFNSQANEGGAFYSENTQTLQMKNIYIVESNAVSGGIFYISSCTNFILENFIAINSNATEGGSFYLESVSSFLKNLTIINSTATSLGGVFYIDGNGCNIVVENATFLYCNAAEGGGVLWLSNAQNLMFVNVLIFYSQVISQIGEGVMSLNSFSIESKNDALFLFKNVSFLNNVGIASCIFYFSNIKTQIVDCIMKNTTGTALSFESDGTGMLEVLNFSITQSNWYGQFSENYGYFNFFSFQNIALNISLLSLIDNKNGENLIDLTNCTGMFTNSLFNDFFPLQNSSDIYLFSSTSSNLIFSNIGISYSDLVSLSKMNFFYLVSNVLISFINGTFSNAMCGSSSIFYFENSVVNLQGCIFEKLGGTYAVVFSTTTNLSIKNSTFRSNQNQNPDIMSEKYAVDLYFVDDTIDDTIVSINNSTFQIENIGNSIYLSNILIFKIDSSNFFSSFASNSTEINFENTYSRAIYFDACTSINLNSTIFFGFSASQGGAISLYKLNSLNLTLTITISNCHFEENKGNFGGAIYMEGSVILNTFNTNFIHNIAENITNFNFGEDVGGKGAALLSNCEYYPLCKVSVENSTFVENLAENFGSTFLIKSINQPDSKNENIFINNTDCLNFTSAIASLPVKLHLLDLSYEEDVLPTLKTSKISTIYEQINNLISTYETNHLTVASGQTFSFMLLFTDFYNQTLVFDEISQATLTCYTNKSYSEMVVLDKEKASSEGGILNFKDVLIIHIPDFNLSCNISLVYDNSIFIDSLVDLLDSAQNTQVARNMNISVDIYIRNCLNGEIYMEDQSCRVCANGSFSVEDPMNSNDLKCLACPINFNCFGGDTLYPNPGSWRYSIFSSIALTCPTEESCLGVVDYSNTNTSVDGVIMGQCHPNYWGNLCYMCKTGYGRLEENSNCQLCTQQVWVYLKIALGFIFLFGYVYVQVKVYSNLRSDNPNMAILLKLFLNHFQIIAMVSVIDFEWPDDFNIYFSLQEYFSCLYQDFFNIDCLVQAINQNLLTEKIIFSILLPIILSVIMLLYWIVTFLLAIRKHKDENEKIALSSYMSSKIRVTFLSLIFILYPEILRKCFMLLNCILIDHSTNYSVLLYSPNIQCWGSEHTLWTLTIAFPGILVWGIITPLLILGALFRYRIQIKNFLQKEEENMKINEDFTRKNKIIKEVLILIEPAIKEKILRDIQLPLKKKTKYKLGNKVIFENFEINVKNREQIESISKPELSENPTIFTTQPANTTHPLFTDPNTKKQTKENLEMMEILTSKSNPDNFKNDAYFIKDPNILLSHLSFMENLEEKIIRETNLQNNLVYFQVTYKSKEGLEKKDSKRNSFFEKKLNKTNSFNLIENDSLVFRNLGFIYKGYNETFYYWEIILFSRKFLLIFIGVFTEFFPKATRDMNLILIMMIYFVAQINCEPFHKKFLNNLETLSLFIATLTCYFGIFFYSTSLKKASLFFLIVIIVLNVFYLILWFYYFRKFANIEQLWKRIKKSISCWSEKLKEIISKIKEKMMASKKKKCC